MAASTPANKRAAARKAPAKAAPAKAPADPRLASVPKHLAFSTTPYTKAELEARPTVELSLDGEVFTARRPDDGFLGYQVAEIVGAGSNVERIVPLMQLTWAIFDESSRIVINRRLRDPNDSFGHDTLLDMATHILKEWGLSLDVSK